MKRREQLLASLLAMAMAGCSSTGMNDSNTSASKLGASQGGGYGAVNSTSDSGTAASDSDTYSNYGGTSGANTAVGSGAGQAAATQAGTGQTTISSTAITPNSTVTSIEVVQRQPGTVTSGSTAVGGTGSGATASGATGDRIYRITLRMDDGTAQVVTQEWAPSFSTGDRVRTISGAIQR